MSAAPVMLRIGPAERAILREQAQLAYPKECCGLLIGREDGGGLRVTRVQPSVNQDPDGGARAFEVDPALILSWHRQLRGTAERIIGHYHSHPNEPARPSPTDLERAWEPGMIWLILAVGRGKLTELGAFRYVEEGRGPATRRGFEPVELAEI